MRIANGAEPRWQGGRMQNPCLPTTRASAGHCWRTLTPGGWDEPPETWYKVEGSERGEAAEDGGDQPTEEAGRGEVLPCRERHSHIERIKGMGTRVPSGVWRVRGEYAGHSPHPLAT